MTRRLSALLLLFVSLNALLQAQGITYRYTVDTPENEGLVSTGVPGALPPVLKLNREEATLKTVGKLWLDFYAGQRSPLTTVRILVPPGIEVTPDNTTVNVIGRGEVLLRDLPRQSVGRTGTNYSYNKVGEVEIRREGAKGTMLLFTGLDFRPANGPDIRLCINGVTLSSAGDYKFEASYTTSEPAILHSPVATATLKGGTDEGGSLSTRCNSDLWDVKTLGVKGDDATDDTDALNKAIRKLNSIGGGILYFPTGTYHVRTVHLLSNVWLHLSSGATICALPGADAPETTWFSDRAYRSGLSPTDSRPYAHPENYLTKQDVGHTFFRNAMFWGERIDNVKIMGTGRITGNGNIVTSDKVMNNPPERRCDKMFSLKLCTNIEIGGWSVDKDMWYDPQKDEPYYIEKDGSRNYDVSNMLHIDQGGHFVLLATGTDGIYVHDTYFAKHSPRNARDIYDFMACNDVTVTNIYSRVSSDDIVKLGSDCSLGFTRPARNYKVRNIVGDTNCNLFQIGSETADDIQDVYVDNIYVLGANKAGFSISTNDGGHVKNVYLNSGKTGPIHSRSVMRRTRAPFFISISNRGRVIGADVAPFTFRENGAVRKELLVTNCNIGRVENIVIRGVDIDEVYGGSSFRGDRWKAYDGSQHKATPIIAGFKLPDTENVEGGLTFCLPDGRHTGYIENIQFHNVNLRVKGGHPAEDAEARPPEIGVGRYNVGDLKIQPAFGFWARHVKGFVLDNCKIDAEAGDGRYPVVLDDVRGAEIRNLQVTKGITDKEDIHNTNTTL